MKFTCPICKRRLVEFGAAAKCEKNHSFDRAKEGYYNLLVSQSVKNHGDNAEMVEARRNFLNTGLYYPLAEKVLELIRTSSEKKDGDNISLLDIGSGEGYYTDIIERGLKENFKASVSAFDISRDAVRRAAKRNKSISFAVASAYHMPVADGDFDVALNMFSPLAKDEVLRSLCDGGIFVMAIPGENHLYGLKAATYDEPYKNEVQDSYIEGFSLLSENRISYKIKLTDKDVIKSLFMMTPYAYKTSVADTERLFSRSELETELEFIVFVYKKA